MSPYDDLSLDELSLESLNYQANYNTYGIRRTSEFYSPPMFHLNEILLPRNSVYHHFDMDDVSIGPRPDTPEIAKYPQRILIDHVREIDTVLGNPRLARGNPIREGLAEYRRKYRRLRPLNNFDRTVEEENTLIVVNYNLVTNAHIYPASRFSGYYRWYNMIRAFFNEIEAKMTGNARHHYISFELPPRMPSRRVLIMGQNDYQSLNPSILSLLGRPKYLFLVELWKWLGDRRKDSLMDAISEENYGKLNIIIKDQGHWCVINLERLQGMIGEYDELDDESGGAFGSPNMQRQFLRFLSAVMSLRSSAGPEVDEEVEEPSSDDTTRSAQTPQEASGDTITKDRTTGTKIRKEAPQEASATSTVAKDPESKPIQTKEEVEEDADATIETTAEEEAENIEELNELLDEVEEGDRPVAHSANEHTDPSDALKEKYEDLAELGQLTAAEYKRLERMREKTKLIPNPYGDEGTLTEYAKVSPELVRVNDEDRNTISKIDGVVDPSMSQASLDYISKKYYREVLQRDVSSAVLEMQRAGIIVQDYKVEEVDLIGSNYYEVSVRVTPIDGGASTLRFKYPKVDDYGTFEAGGVKYRMKHQRGDLPIRKVSPESVALTTYYAKVFVDRSQRAVVNYPRWLIRQLNLIIMDDEDNRLSNAKHTDVNNHENTTPRIYSLLATNYSGFLINNKYDFMFDYAQRLTTYDEKEVKALEKNGYVVCGHQRSKGRPYLLVDDADHFYVAEGAEIKPIGDIEDLLELDGSKAPTEVAEFRLFSKNVPVGIALGYFYGLNGLMSRLDVRPRRVAKGGRLNLEPHEYVLRFSDETLVFSRKDKVATLVLAGFNRYHKEIARYSADGFNSPDVYVNIMEEQGLRVGFIRELDLAMDLFVDHISREILQEMNEPTSLDRLLIRSCELLTTDWHPRENDRLYQRDRGYERFAGHVYGEMVRAVRKYRSRGIGKEAKVEMNPESVWMEIIAKDASVFPVEESNPIRDIKEREDATYSGAGGRSNRSMVKHTRSFNKSDMGLTSEATTDSGSTGVNFSLPPNPNHVSLRGIGKAYDPKDKRTSAMISSSMLLAPNGDQDDAKRMNFISIQHSHGVAASGGEASPYATGYDKVLAHRCSPLFSAVAEAEGEVVTYKEDRYLEVQFASGEKKKVTLGKEYGTVTGTTVPHRLISDLRKGDKVKEGQVLAYHEGFFQTDPLDPGQVLWKMGVIAKTAFMERPNTFEDSCEVSEAITGSFVTPLTHIRDIVVSFRGGVRNMVQVGEEVDSETILCMLEDEVTRSNDMFDEESLQTLSILGGSAPRAEHAGVVDKIEVLYHGDLEDMGPDLSGLVEVSDRQMKQRMRDKGQRPKTGRVDDTLRIGRDPLDIDTAAIRVYITEQLPAGEGDKGVLGNQMKTVISNVMSGINRTEDGYDVDVLFSYKSVANRMLESAKIMGSTITLLKVMSQIVYEYHHEK